jgi:ParB family transcriptional regulator, chromosome partitioning protein
MKRRGAQPKIKKKKSNPKKKMEKKMSSSALDRSSTRLGKGLSAIFADSDPIRPDPGARVRNMPIEQIAANDGQPRKFFAKEALEELADSIREKGILQPILVRPHRSRPASYEIVAGERRWRAAQMAGIHEVPVIVRDLKDKETLEIALIENIQRKDLTAMEEAETFQRLVDEHGHTTEELAEALGKSRSHIANMLRLNGLPEEVKEMVSKGELSAGHARALLGAADPYALAQEVVRLGLSVRQTENLVNEGREKKPDVSGRADRKSGAGVQKDADALRIEKDMSSHLGLKVILTPQGPGGRLTIEYKALEQLDDILARLSQPGAPSE